jgi:DnaJ-class molecular chaperone
VQIEAGMDNGSSITFAGQSEQNPDWFPGDIVFVLKVRNHPRFQRKGNDLYTNVRISLKEALLGYTKQISHLDGHVVQIESKGVTQPNFVRTIQGEGMPHHDMPSNKGDLYVTFLVDLPNKLTPEQEELVRKLLPR